MKKTIWSLLAVCAIAALQACATAQPAPPASAPQPLAASAKASRIVTTATLALANTCEVDVAADYTAVIASRQRATRLLTERRITVAQAQQVQDLADAARARLVAACPDKAATFKPTERDAARAALTAISTILEGQ